LLVSITVTTERVAAFRFGAYLKYRQILHTICPYGSIGRSVPVHNARWGMGSWESAAFGT